MINDLLDYFELLYKNPLGIFISTQYEFRAIANTVIKHFRVKSAAVLRRHAATTYKDQDGRL